MKMFPRVFTTFTLCASLFTTQAIFANETVNINTATVEELTEHMTGIGEKRAEAIIAYRDTNGNFTTVDDLLSVDGIGEVTLERNRERLAVN